MSIRHIHQMAYFPPAMYEQARERDLLDATSYREHADYRREVEQQLQAMSADGRGPMRLVTLDVPGLLAYAERTGKDPASRRTRLAYVSWLGEQGADTVAWPPERNAACWCGSGRKYKKCCAAPGFLAVEPADPALLVLTIDLDHVTPRVWRRVAIPSNTALDQVHRMIQDAMGWYDERPYAFGNDEYTIVDSRSVSGGIRADAERLVSIATEDGDQFSYTYGLGDEWTHTVTLDEARPRDPGDVFTVLDGAGPCPPEDIGGACSYQRLLTAYTDPADPHHDEATDILGEHFDPAAAIDPGVPQARTGRRIPASASASGRISSWLTGDAAHQSPLVQDVRQAMSALADAAVDAEPEVYTEAQSFRQFGDAADPLDVEIHTARLLARFDQAQPAGSLGLALGLVTVAARHPRPHVAAMAAAVGYFLPGMATTMALRDLTRQGIRPPSWAERLGDVEPRRAWRYRDVFGDQEILLVTFYYDDAEHGILVETVTCPEPMACLIHLSGTVAELRDILQRSADETGGQRVLEEITLAQARAALAHAVWQPHRDAPPESLAWLPIVRRRVACLPEPEPVDAVQYTRADRVAAVDAFLTATAPPPGVDREVLRFWAQVLAGYTATGGSAPTRIGPVWLGHVLGEHVPRMFDVTAAQRAGLCAAVTAWAGWAARQQGLPDPAVDLLTARIAEIDEAFDRVYVDPELAAVRCYVTDVAAVTADGENLRRTFALRAVAVPLPEQRAPARRSLLASDPVARRQILADEFKTWQLSSDQSVPDWLDALVSVSDQLWNQDPPDLAHEVLDYLDQEGPDSELLFDLTQLALEHGDDPVGYLAAALARVQTTAE